MIEAGAIEVSEDTVADALRIRARTDQAHHRGDPPIARSNQAEQSTVPPLAFDEALAKEIEQKYGAQLARRAGHRRNIPRRKAIT